MDLDDELLGLAEGTSTKRKSKSSSSKSKSSKRKRPAQQEDSASDMDMSSEDEDAPPARKAKRDQEDEADDGPVDLFPLEGKYKDAEDRAAINAMGELDREAILGERLEQIHAQEQREQLRQMVKRKEKQERGEDSGSDDEQPLRTGRNRKATGTTDSKREQLERLKESRAAKGKKKDKHHSDDDDYSSPPRRRHSSRGYDSGSESDRSDFEAAAAAVAKGGKKPTFSEEVGPSGLKDLMVTRAKLAEFCAAPWFASWVEGAWVRYLVGEDRGMPQYRLCQVDGVKEVPEKPYTFEGAKTTIQLELRHGAATRLFTMEGISNSTFNDGEFGRLAKTLGVEKLHLPTIKDAQKIKNNLDKRKEYILTEADVSAILKQKGSRVNPAAGKARLIIQRDFARQTGDHALLAEVNASLAKLEAPPPSPGSSETEQERMRKVNERNRATNREEIKRAEGKAQDERRRQAAALARGDSDVKVDPSARVKTMTRLKYDRDTPSRPSTPVVGGSQNGSAPTAADVALAADNSRAKGSKFEEKVAANVEVDIDLDF